MSSVNNLKPCPVFNIEEVEYFFNEHTLEPDSRLRLAAQYYHRGGAERDLIELRKQNPQTEYFITEATSYE